MNVEASNPTMEKNRLGMLAFIASEAVFFLLLIVSYLYFQSQPGEGPTAASSLDPLVTGFFSLFLFSSSFTIWRSGQSLNHGRHRQAGYWLVATILLGVVFLLGQGAEWSRLIQNGTTISRNLFGSTFFTLTGFHGLHVIIGLISLGILAGLMLGGHIKGSHSAGMEAISVYWHFVDAVWVVLYAVIYLQIIFTRL